MSKKPWDIEGDEKLFLSRRGGLQCVILRHYELRHLCGYVGVKRTHPYAGLDLNADEVGGLAVHGGVTWSKTKLPDALALHLNDQFERSVGWWFGFACAHAGDMTPGLDSKIRDRLPRFLRGAYRTMDYVQNECERLAFQLDRVARGKSPWPTGGST